MPRNVSFKVCCFAMGWESGLLSLSDRCVVETKTRESKDEVDKYYGRYVFKCWIMFEVLSDLYYDPTNPAGSSFFNFFSTLRCFCYWVAEMFPNKWFKRFWRLRQIAENCFFARYVDTSHQKSALTLKKTQDFLPSLSECTLRKSNVPFKNIELNHGFSIWIKPKE